MRSASVEIDFITNKFIASMRQPSTFLLSSLLICFCGFRVGAEENLPSIDQVKERMAHTISLIENIQVQEETVRRQRDFNGGEELYEMKRECSWTITADGKRHFTSTGETLNFNNKGATNVPYKIELAFDGTTSRNLRYLSRDLTRIFAGEVDDYPMRYTMLPTEFTVLWGKESLLDIINKRPFHVDGSEEILGRQTLVLIGDAIKRDGWHWNRRIHFDMERGIPLKTAYVMKRPDAEEWIEYAVWASLDHEEVIPGVWLPKKYRKYSFNVKADGSPIEFSDGYVGSYSNWKVNQKLPAGQFTLLFPDNVPVNDQRPMQNGRLLSKEEIKELNNATIKEIEAASASSSVQ